MKPGPFAAAQLVESFVQLDGPPIQSRTLLERIIISEGWEISSEAVMETAERWEARFLKRLSDRVSDAILKGSPVYYGLNSANPSYIQGSCFIEPDDDNIVAQEKTNRSRLIHFRDVLKNITPAEFETLCGKLLSLLNVESPVVTRRTADEGLDFFGVLHLAPTMFPLKLHHGAERSLKVWIVGQAKKYEINLSTSAIRELVGSVDLARAKAFGSTTDPLEQLDIKLCDPTVYMIVTTGKITSNSRRLLERSGVIGMDGEQVAMFLADREIGIVNGSYNETAFYNWLKE